MGVLEAKPMRVGGWEIRQLLKGRGAIPLAVLPLLSLWMDVPE